MKKLYILILIFFSLSTEANYWTQKANFPGSGRSMPLCFSIGDNGYVYGGRNSVGGPTLSDFWEYNQPSNSWTQKANFPGTQRIWGTSFSLGNKGYLGLGTAMGNYLKDIWEYNPVNNTWTQKNDFPGGGRYFPIGFTVGNNAYAGMGIDTTSSYATDIWEYDPATDTWTQKQNFGGAARATNCAFSVGTKAYVGLGYIIGQSSSGFLDFWEYDVTTNAWTQVANFPGTTRTQMASFTLGNKGYVGVGNQLVPNSVLNDFWEYDPVFNTWTQKAYFGGMPRDEIAFCSINNKGYIGLGWQNGVNLFNDWWEYSPDSTTGISDFRFQISDFTVYPNPANDFVVCSLQFAVEKKIELTITNVEGKKVYQNSLDTRYLILDTKIDISQFSNGIYFVTVSNEKEKLVKKFIKN